MDPRIALGLISALGAFSGAALMIATTPSTGAMPGPVAQAPVEAAPALPTAAPEAANPFDAPPPTPVQPPGQDNPLGLPPVEADPWKALEEGGGDNPFGAPPAEPPLPPGGRINPLRPQQGVVVTPGGPYPADVRGVGQMFRDKETEIKDCMSRQGPAANPGEMAVMLRLHLKSDPGAPQGGGIERIEAVQDTEGRYQHFLGCVQGIMQGAALQAPASGTSIVHWSVRR